MKVDLSNVLEERVGDGGLSRHRIEEVGKLLENRFFEPEVYEEDRFRFTRLPGEVDAREIQDVGDRLSDEFDYFVNVGIGGSSLGAATLTRGLHPDSNTYFLDNVDPEYMSRIVEEIEFEDTVFNVVSKSGSTAETAINFVILKEMLEERVADWRNHVVVTTGKEGPLHKIEEEVRASFRVPENVPGRFSALSPVGLVSAAFAGADVSAILEGGIHAQERCLKNDVDENPAASLAAVSYLLFDEEDVDVTVMMPYAERLELFSEWFCQLWAESLGKKRSRDISDQDPNRVGLTPVDALGVTDQHSLLQLLVDGPDDKLVNFMEVENTDDEFKSGSSDLYPYLEGVSLSRLREVELKATASSLVYNGKPNLTVSIDRVDEESLGEVLYVYMFTTALMGELLELNTFNQPGVEDGKEAMYGALGKEGYGGENELIDSYGDSIYVVD
ncbi:MAG: glucose-6-phosphate isomerase [Halobacteria archaeon]